MNIVPLTSLYYLHINKICRILLFIIFRIFPFIILYRLIYNPLIYNLGEPIGGLEVSHLYRVVPGSSGVIRIAARTAAGNSHRCPYGCQKKRPKKTPAENFNRGFSLSVTNIHVIAPSYPLYAVKSESPDRPQTDNII